MSDALNAGLAGLLLVLAVWTTVARESHAAVVAFTAYGLLLAPAWVQLSGIDVALTEAAIGGGLTGALLIGAAGKLRGRGAALHAQHLPAAVRWLAAGLCAVIACALAAVVLMLPTPAPTLAPEVVAHLAATGVGNPITAVLMSYRAIDTLLEAIVLLFALIGVWSVASDAAWGGRPGMPQPADPNGMLAYVARLLPPIGLVVGVYLFWIGADAPGGKFQGSTLLAAMWLLVVIAGLADAPAVGRAGLRRLLVAGPIAFIGVGLVGAATSGAFLAYPDGLAKPLIILVEVALLPTLTLVLGLLMLGTPARGERS